MIYIDLTTAFADDTPSPDDITGRYPGGRLPDSCYEGGPAHWVKSTAIRPRIIAFRRLRREFGFCCDCGARVTRLARGYCARSNWPNFVLTMWRRDARVGA